MILQSFSVFRTWKMSAEGSLTNGNSHSTRASNFQALREKCFNMYKNKVVVVLGAQWGDEGKGKMVDILANEMDVVCRCQVSFFHNEFLYKINVKVYITN